MHKFNYILLLFLFLVVAQLYVPAKMIWDQEKIITTGTEFNFKTAPIDPSDPFRGKYITLSYDENTYLVNYEDEFKYNDVIYVLLKNDVYSFAKIDEVLKQPPTSHSNYVQAKVSGVNSNAGHQEIHIQYPFDRFYMEESKAYEAEKVYRETLRNDRKPAYAQIYVKDGKAVVKDVLIDGKSIRDIVSEREK